jgi:Sulfotransferase family
MKLTYPGVKMQVDHLLAAAREQAGLSNLDDENILEGLGILVNALNAEANLSEQGAKTVEGMIIATLVNRLKVEDYLTHHPELLERPVEKPMFVFGLPRTGTTLVINMLHADPARRSLLRWEAFNSVPPPKHSELSAGPRYEAEQARLDMSMKYMPHISAIHHEDADSPSECQFAMTPSFCSQVYDSQFHVPSYSDWFLNRADYTAAFRYHKRLLQLLQAEAPGKWTLKNPWHPLFLNELTGVYPDAQLVMTHRDPVDVVGSACSLLKAVRPIFSDEIDNAAIAETLLRTFDVMIERTIAFEEKHGAGSIYHLHYPALMADPLGEAKKLYGWFDEPLTKEAEASMTVFLGQNPKGKHGGHRYALEDYGLTPEGVRAHFNDYCDRFGVAQKQ